MALGNLGFVGRGDCVATPFIRFFPLCSGVPPWHSKLVAFVRGFVGWGPQFEAC